MRIFLSATTAFAGMTYSRNSVAEESTTRVSAENLDFKFEGIPYRAQANKVTFSYTTLDGNNLEIEIPRDQNPERPSALGEWLAKQAKRGKDILRTQSHAAANSVRRFPTESLAFGIALGGLAMAQLTFDESLNPVSIAQHVHAQADPLTHLSFMGFMLASGQITEPWMAATSSPTLRQFIPYFGMTAGMMASNMIHELAVLPHAWTCSAELKKTFLTGIAPKPGKDGRTECQKFEDFWMKMNFWDSFHQYCPMFMSMFASSFVSGVLQIKIGGALYRGGQGMMRVLRTGVVAGSLRQAANGTTAGKIALEGLELFATGVAPGGAIRWGVRGAGKLLQIAAFIGLDAYFFQAPFANAYSNWDLGVKFNLLNIDLMRGMIQNSRTNWAHEFPNECHFRDQVAEEDDVFISDEQREALQKDRAKNGVAKKLRCMNELEKSLSDLSNTMEKWQNQSMREVMTSQSAWEEKLSRLSAQYLGSKNFYSYFVNSIWDAEFNPTEKNNPQTFESAFPLNGIVAKDVDSSKIPKALLLQPWNVMDQQMATVKDTVSEFAKKMQENKGDFSQLTPLQRSTIAEILRELSSADVNVVGKAIDKLLAQFNGQSFRGASLLPKPYGDILHSIRKKLGNPKPIWNKGEGLALYYLLDAENKSISDAAKFPMSHARVSTPNSVEYMLMTMLSGPEVDSGAALVAENWGWADSWTPPRIMRQDFLTVPQVTSRSFQGRIFNTRLFVDPTVTTAINYNFQRQAQNPKVLQFERAYDYLAKPNAYRSDVLSQDNRVHSIDRWWQSKVEPQFAKAWVSYENKYQENIAKMMKSLWRKQTSFWDNGPTRKNKDSNFNPSDISNSLIEAFRQERKVYLLVLGEIYKSIVASGEQSAKIPTALLAGPKLNVNTRDIDTSKKAKLDYLEQWGCSAAIGSSAGGSARGTSFDCLNDATAAPEIYPLFAMLRQNDLLDMAALTRPWDLANPSVSPLTGQTSAAREYSRIFKTEPIDQNLGFQTSILSAFNRFEAALKKIEPIEFAISGENYFATKSPLSNQDLNDLYKGISVELLKLRVIFNIRNSTVYKTADEIKEQDTEEMSDWIDVVQQLEAMGIDSNEFKQKAGLPMTAVQLAVAKKAYDGLRRQALNLKYLGLTANAVSYREKVGGNYLVNPRCVKNQNSAGCKTIPQAALRGAVN